MFDMMNEPHEHESMHRQTGYRNDFPIPFISYLVSHHHLLRYTCYTCSCIFVVVVVVVIVAVLVVVVVVAPILKSDAFIIAYTLIGFFSSFHEIRNAVPVVVAADASLQLNRYNRQ